MLAIAAINADSKPAIENATVRLKKATWSHQLKFSVIIHACKSYLSKAQASSSIKRLNIRDLCDVATPNLRLQHNGPSYPRSYQSLACYDYNLCHFHTLLKL